MPDRKRYEQYSAGHAYNKRHLADKDVFLVLALVSTVSSKIALGCVLQTQRQYYKGSVIIVCPIGVWLRGVPVWLASLPEADPGVVVTVTLEKRLVPPVLTRVSSTLPSTPSVTV